jgi:hypothetical protein
MEVSGQLHVLTTLPPEIGGWMGSRTGPDDMECKKIIVSVGNCIPAASSQPVNWLTVKVKNDLTNLADTRSLQVSMIE